MAYRSRRGREGRRNPFGATWWAALTVLLVVACSPPNPLDRLRRDLDVYPEYTVVLQDMKRTGNFTKDYYHQYRVVYGEPQEGAEELVFRDSIYDWMRVDRKLYDKYQPYLGMTVLAKSADGEVEEAHFPPGYQYVGNDRYGSWQTDSTGRSFWAFYGQYAFMSSLFGSFRQPLYRSDWDDYRGYRRDRRPYYGPGNSFGTSGSYTRTTNPTFFERQKARQSASKQRFSDKVKSRAASGRTQRSRGSAVRSRSSGRGGK